MLKLLTTTLMMLVYSSTTEGCGRTPNKPPVLECPEVASVTADAGQTSVYMSWSQPVVDDDDDDDLPVLLESGNFPHQYFSEGYHISTYRTEDTEGLTSTCAVSFDVYVTRCEALPRPTHGSISCDLDDNIYGRRCSFSCADGYWLDGSTSSVCQSNGYNSHSAPVCRKIQCGDLTMPALSVGYECTHGNYFESVCVVFCDASKGYTPVGHHHAICNADKQWSYHHWECLDTERPRFSNCIMGEMRTSVFNFVWPTITATDNSGSVNMTQTQGPTPGSTLSDDSHLVQYEAVDPAGNEAPPCVFSVTYEPPACQPPKPAAKDTEPTFQCLNHKVGSHCQASCLTRVEGSSYIQCRQTGGVIPTSEWFPTDGDFPTCYKKSCDALPTPTNGALVCDTFLGGNICQMHCNTDYDVPQDLSHLATLTCVRDNWIPNVDTPQCTELQLPDFYNLRSRSYYFSGDCSESSEAIRKSFIENFKKVADYLCPEDTCTVENVEVKCGKVEEGDPWDDWGRRSVPDDISSDTSLSSFETFTSPSLPPTSSPPTSSSPPPTSSPPTSSSLPSTTSAPPTSSLPSTTSAPPTSSSLPSTTSAPPTSSLPSTTSAPPTSSLPSTTSVPPTSSLPPTSARPSSTSFLPTSTRSPSTFASYTPVPSTPLGTTNSSSNYTFTHTIATITGSPNTDPNVTSDGIGTSSSTASPVQKTHHTAIQYNFIVKNSADWLSGDDVVFMMSQIISNTTMNIGGVEVKFNKTINGSITFNCGGGKTVSNSSATMCLACPPGTFHNQSRDQCQLCPLNYFSDKSGQMSCTPCKQYSGTERNGSSSRQQCKAMCTPGQYSETGFAPCYPCQFGFYQSEYFNTSCNRCPSDTTSLQLGASSLHGCIPFDLAATGPVDLNFGSVIHDWVEELTVAFWVDILPPLDKMVNISLTFTHPTRGHQLTWFLKNRTDITMRDDNVNVQTSVRHSLWTHMALVWKGYPSFVDMYVGGRRVDHYGGHTPLCFLPQGTELTVHIGDNTGATIRGMYVIPRSNSSDLIASMANSCSAGDIGWRSLVANIKPSNSSLISMVVPSACSEINRCDPDPCPGHHCTSLPHDFVCVCMGGYSGKDCSTPPDFCLVDNKCVNGATCTNTNTSINCTCTEDFKGRYCEEAIVHGNWGPWSSWSSCSSTCGGGQRSRIRLCNNPAAEAVYGKPCPGSATDLSTCNSATCPECLESQLLLGKGVSASCVEAEDGSMNCSVSCDEGLVFPGPEPSYTCRDEIWTPSNKTVSCVEMNVPENVGLMYTIRYATVPGDISAERTAIKEKVSQCVSSTACGSDKTCTYNISVETCLPGNHTCVQGYQATVRCFIYSLPTQTELKAAWNVLNRTRTYLERIHDVCFIANLSSGYVNPGISVTKNTMTCQEGFVPDKGYCSACATGTHYINQTCAACAKGWYQEDTGQMACSMCPAASNTVFKASTLVSECRAPPSDAFMLLVDPTNGQTWSANMSTFSPVSVPLPSAVHAEAASYDAMSGQYFYGDRVRPGIRAVQDNQTATLVNLGYSASVGDIAVDVISQLIFYTDKGTDVIGVVTIQTQFHKIVIKQDAHRPKHIVLDSSNGTLYWIDWGREQLIERALYDGTERKELFRSNSQWPLGLALDAQNEKLYWTEGSGKTVQVMGVDGSNRRTVLTSDSLHPFSLTTFNGYIFYSFSTQTDAFIMRANTDGSGIGRTELPHFKFVSNMQTHSAYFNSSAVTNGCVGGNGGCPFICFPRPRGQRECACPEGYTRQDNKRDCIKGSGGGGHWFERFMKPKFMKRDWSGSVGNDFTPTTSG